VQQYIMESNHGVLDYMVIANTKWWEGLPADIRKVLNEAMVESIKFGNEVSATEDANFRAKVIADNKAKVLPMSKEHLAAWRTAMQPVWKKFESDIGDDLIQAAQKANM
jgi:C4-dicarboxylate-binding protein DctP